MKSRKCTICGKEFLSKNGIEVCSEECRIERKIKYDQLSNYRRYHKISNEPITYTCAVCGKQFEGLRQKYCSIECRKIGRKRCVDANNKAYFRAV